MRLADHRLAAGRHAEAAAMLDALERVHDDDRRKVRALTASRAEILRLRASLFLHRGELELAAATAERAADHSSATPRRFSASVAG